jgi:hypothetical protein
VFATGMSLELALLFQRRDDAVIGFDLLDT